MRRDPRSKREQMAAAIDHSGPEPSVRVSVVRDRALNRAIDIALAGPVRVIDLTFTATSYSIRVGVMCA